MSVGGNNTTNVQIPRFANIPYAKKGFTFANPTQAGKLGIRKSGNIELTSVVRVDTIGREQLDAYLATIDIELWQDDFTSLFNYYLLVQDFIQLSVPTAAGDIYNFVDNTATPPFGTPNGSVVLGATLDFECTSKELACKMKLMGKMHPKEYDYLLAHTNAANPGGSGGTSASLTAMGYDETLYGVPGIQSITLGGDDQGLLADDSKISMKFKEVAKTTREQPIVKMCEVELDINCLQARYSDLQANAAQRNSDFTTVVTLWNGITFSFVNSLSVTTDAHLGEDKVTRKAKLKGMIPFDPLGTQSNIVWTPGTSTVTFNRIGY